MEDPVGSIEPYLSVLIPALMSVVGVIVGALLLGWFSRRSDKFKRDAEMFARSRDEKSGLYAKYISTLDKCATVCLSPDERGDKDGDLNYWQVMRRSYKDVHFTLAEVEVRAPYFVAAQCMTASRTLGKVFSLEPEDILIPNRTNPITDEFIKVRKKMVEEMKKDLELLDSTANWRQYKEVIANSNPRLC